MGNKQKETAKYNFQDQFQILYQHDNYYQLKKRESNDLYIGRVIQSADEDHIEQLQGIIQQKIDNPSPFVSKLQRHRVFKQQSPCFKTWVHFYLLLPKQQYTLYNEMQRRSQQRQIFSESEIDITLLRMCKGLKYIYGINDQYCVVSSKSVVWPVNGVIEQLKLIDPWAVTDRPQYKEQYEENFEDQYKKQGKNNKKFNMDLYRVGIVGLQMIYCGHGKLSEDKKHVVNSIKNVKNENLRTKVQILCNPETSIRGNYYRYFQRSQTRSQKSTQQSPYDPNSRKSNNYSNGYQRVVQTPFSKFGLNKQQVINQVHRNQAQYNYHKQIQHTPINDLISKFPSPFNREISKPNVGNNSINYPLSHKYSIEVNKYEGQIPSYKKYEQNNEFPNFADYEINKINPYQLQYSQNPKIRSFDPHFQVNNNSSSDNNLFTPPDFFNRLKGQKHSPLISNIYPYSSSLTTNNILVNQKQMDSKADKNFIGKSKSVQSIENYQIQKKQKSRISEDQKNNFNDIKILSEQDINQDLQVNNSNEIQPYQTKYIPSNKKTAKYGPIVEIYSELYSSVNSNQEGDDDRQYVDQTYDNKSHYQGFKSKSTGLKNGKGVFHYSEGSYYDGQWKDNSMHGYGKLYYANHKPAYQGQWFFDQFHGKGKVFNDDPVAFDTPFNYQNFDNLEEQWEYYEGTLVSDSKEGEGKLVLSNGEYYEGQFQNDRINGQGKFYTLSGEIIKGVWNNSLLIEREE